MVSLVIRGLWTGYYQEYLVAEVTQHTEEQAWLAVPYQQERASSVQMNMSASVSDQG